MKVMTLKSEQIFNIIFGVSLLGLALSCTDYWNEMGAKCSCLNACLSCSDHYQSYNLTKCQIQCTRTKQIYVDHIGYNYCRYGLRPNRRRYHREIFQIETESESAIMISEQSESTKTKERSPYDEPTQTKSVDRHGRRRRALKRHFFKSDIENQGDII